MAALTKNMVPVDCPNCGTTVAATYFVHPRTGVKTLICPSCDPLFKRYTAGRPQKGDKTIILAKDAYHPARRK